MFPPISCNFVRKKPEAPEAVQWLKITWMPANSNQITGKSHSLLYRPFVTYTKKKIVDFKSSVFSIYLRNKNTTLKLNKPQAFCQNWTALQMSLGYINLFPDLYWDYSWKLHMDVYTERSLLPDRSTEFLSQIAFNTTTNAQNKNSFNIETRAFPSP